MAHSVIHSCKAACIACLMLLLPLTTICHAGGEPADEPVSTTEDPARPGWMRLVYTGNALTGKVTTTLSLVESSADSLDIPGVRFPDDSITPVSAQRIYLLAISAQGAASNTILRIWFDAMTGAVLQRDRLKTGEDGTRKTVRFGPDGAVRVRLKPADRVQAQSTPATWMDRKDKVFPYDLATAGCHHVTVPALLLYIISVTDNDSAERKLCVFQDGALYRVRLYSAGRKELAIDYTVSSVAGSYQVTGTREIEQIRLDAESISGDADPDEFELLELRGAIGIQVDTATGLPVVVSGNRGLYRDIQIYLTEVTLTD
ncbi:MAG: hypothetical protein JSU75_05045 [Gammaproteobacteria bacterium]|nr:MAG: hypothetical protein JSU75_05045 [Gammaproteobacteria bacterium]